MKSILLLCVLILIILSACKENTFTEEHILTGFSVYKIYEGTNYNNLVTQDDYHALYEICFVDRDHGWILMDRDSIIRTTNNGKTWEKQFIEHFETGNDYGLDHFKDIYFLDTLNGWVGATNNTLYNTTDGGKTWIKRILFPEQMLRTIHNIQFTDNQTGWATITNIGPDDAIIKTTDGGNNWEIVYTGLENGIYGLHFTNKTTAFFQNGISINNKVYNWIYKTTDEGKTWHEVFSDTAISLYNSFFLDENIAWIMTDENKFLRTKDGGLNWYYQKINTEIAMSDFTFVDENHGWAISHLPGVMIGSPKVKLIYYTEDGGINWSPLNYWVALDEPNGIVHFHDLFFFDKNEGFISGSKGMILHTTTGGNP